VPFNSHWSTFLWPQRHARSLDRADRAAFEPDARGDRVIHRPPGNERAHDARDGGDLTGEEAGEVDHMRTRVAERAACFLRIETPGVEGRVGTPLLEIAPAEVEQVADLAGVDQLTCKPDCRNEAVVEGAHVLDAGGPRRLRHGHLECAFPMKP
jgi:hypothetical protein